MMDRCVETLEFQRDLLGLSGMARETVHPEWKDVDRLVEDCRQVAETTSVTVNSR